MWPYGWSQLNSNRMKTKQRMCLWDMYFVVLDRKCLSQNHHTKITNKNTAVFLIDFFNYLDTNKFFDGFHSRIFFPRFLNTIENSNHLTNSHLKWHSVFIEAYQIWYHDAKIKVDRMNLTSNRDLYNPIAFMQYTNQ